MSVRFVEGDTLDAEENIIAHQVNCKGVMGEGLAKQIRDKWPSVYDQYKWLCDIFECDNMSKALIGRTQYCWIGDSRYLVNIFGQNDFGRDKSKVYTDYNAVKNCIINVHDTAECNGWTVAIPYGLGCGLDGGDWQGVVLPMILDIFEKSDVEVKIYMR